MLSLTLDEVFEVFLEHQTIYKTRNEAEVALNRLQERLSSELSEQAWRAGYDSGYEEGYEEAGWDS